ncbi:MAG: FliI/YscN family ATPase [Alphaproteobacteria bacterium]|uniref:FliI/YscN family ATPase n=1 Tax=Candidatus Nitrobium versatile TaxID=2884831 RepID=A0A953JEN8_9BACT|nr:FliI/YscN family ATPase [Candidatus Nitrobium versatile]
MSSALQLIAKCRESLRDLDPVKVYGRVSKGVGLVIEGTGPRANIGDVCQIQANASAQESFVEAEVIGFRDDKILLMPLGDMRGIGPGSKIVAKGRQRYVRVGDGLLGRVLDGMGEPLDGKGRIAGPRYPIYNEPINPLFRKRIAEPLDLGIKAINLMITCGKGQRIGIMAGSGVGKSVLLGMIARNTAADINVISLIGERGREVREFIEKDLGAEGLKRSVIVVATSDTSPLMRIRGAFVSTAIAEYFRSRGKDVLLMMDSLTRFAMAQRELGLAAGEPPTTKGYPPSVFNLLPRLLERAGTWGRKGTITGLYTVLVEGDDMNEPIADAARSILDGHIILSRDLANHNHYPAIDVLQSISRLAKDITDEKQKNAVGKVLDSMALYKRYEDVITIGAYKEGTNPKLDQAIRMMDRINALLKQDIKEKVTYKECLLSLFALAENKA